MRRKRTASARRLGSRLWSNRPENRPALKSRSTPTANNQATATGLSVRARGLVTSSGGLRPSFTTRLPTTGNNRANPRPCDLLHLRLRLAGRLVGGLAMEVDMERSDQPGGGVSRDPGTVRNRRRRNSSSRGPAVLPTRSRGWPASPTRSGTLLPSPPRHYPPRCESRTTPPPLSPCTLRFHWRPG